MEGSFSLNVFLELFNKEIISYIKQKYNIDKISITENILKTIITDKNGTIIDRIEYTDKYIYYVYFTNTDSKKKYIKFDIIEGISILIEMCGNGG